jgi:cell division protein FtsW
MISLARKQSRHFFFFIVALTLAGFLIFSSAALGLLSGDGANYTRIVWNQFSVLILGLVGFILLGRFPYHCWNKIAIWLLLVSFGLTLLVFIPNLGIKAGGAYRWLEIGSRTFQPSELLKFAFVIYLAAWLAKIRERVTTWQSGFLPFLLLVGLAGAILIAQPDIGTFVVLFSSALAMFFVAGARWRQLGAILLIAGVSLTVIISINPYARERIFTFLNPEAKKDSSAWQINKSLLAIGSGQLTGRGFGQSLQKFNSLPEPIGDSIFAVTAEEFGLLGSVILVFSFAWFVFWGLRIASRAPDRFGQLLAVGLTVLLATGAFINMASMLGLLPLTGIPLLFVSHGGSALLFSLLGCGIIMNIARSSRH